MTARKDRRRKVREEALTKFLTTHSRIEGMLFVISGDQVC
jgi:hypothetical protein